MSSSRIVSAFHHYPKIIHLFRWIRIVVLCKIKTWIKEGARKGSMSRRGKGQTSIPLLFCQRRNNYKITNTWLRAQNLKVKILRNKLAIAHLGRLNKITKIMGWSNSMIQKARKWFTPLNMMTAILGRKRRLAITVARPYKNNC